MRVTLGTYLKHCANFLFGMYHEVVNKNWPPR